MPKYLIVGGVAGGATTAARLRRNDEHAQIILFERGEYISYANCGLPYYIGAVIRERERLFLQTPKSFNARYNIDVRIRSEVLKIDRAEKTVAVQNLDTGDTYSESYDYLVLSPGAMPVVPPLPGIKDDGIFTLRSVADTDRIRNFIERKKPKRAVIVGAGFIGLEMAENLQAQGISVTIVEMLDQIMNALDFEMAAMVQQQVQARHIACLLGDGVAAFIRQDENELLIKLNSGKTLAAEMVLLSIGVRPENKLAKEAGLTVGALGGISVDAYLATSDPHIYALGDAIEVLNPVTGKPALIPLAGPANKQARIVADNLACGNRCTYPGTVGTAIVKVFDLAAACTGASEKLLRRENIPYIASFTHTASHAGYYPGALPMSIKLLFAPGTGKILGAQIVGGKGVGRRIDVIAAMLQAGKTVYDLAGFEHSYAPPYSSAKDPVNVAGSVADNIVSGKVRIRHWYDIKKLDPAQSLLLDVRTPGEFNQGTIPGALNIPVDSLRARLGEIPKDKTVIVFCGVGLRAYVAYRILNQQGYINIYNLSGGYKTYEPVAGK